MADTITVKPWVVAIFSVLASLTGVVIKDRLTTAVSDSSVITRVEVLEKNVDRLQTDAIPRNEFLQYENGNKNHLDDIANDLKDIKSDLRDFKKLLHLR